MDNLIVVGRDKSVSESGRLAYFGPAYPDAIRFFDTSADSSASPDAVLKGLGKKTIRDWVTQYECSDYHKRFVIHRLRGRNAKTHKTLRRRRPAGGISQYLTLVRRGLAVKFKDTWNTGVLLLQAPLIALLIGLVFGPTLAGDLTVSNFADVGRAMATTVFLLGVSALWFGCSNSARDIVAESPIYRRERMVGLGIPSYLASKVTILAMLCAFQCAVLLAIVGWLGGLAASWSVLYWALFMASIVGVAVGLTVSAAARTGEVGAGVLPLVILPMVILGGVLLPLRDLPRAPVPMNLLAATMPSRWAFEALVLPEAQAREGLDTKAIPPALMKKSSTDSSTGDNRTDMAEPFFPAQDRWHQLPSLPFLVMQIQTVCLVALVGALLKGKDTN
jgi:ABC-type multidrug transport system permease subunit